MSRRTEKVEEVLRDIVSEILLREMKDPRLGFLTITGVQVSPDLRSAHIYYSVLGDEAQQKTTADALRRASGFVRTQVGRRTTFRFVPELDFRYDPSVQHGSRVMELLEQVHREEQSPAATPTDEAGTQQE
ncbi:MAG TPA: 30S ribosome-binding factor RbfA [Armatimonadota bacterium]|jgi:ribosome-binding factor A